MADNLEKLSQHGEDHLSIDQAAKSMFENIEDEKMKERLINHTKAHLNLGKAVNERIKEKTGEKTEEFNPDKKTKEFLLNHSQEHKQLEVLAKESLLNSDNDFCSLLLAQIEDEFRAEEEYQRLINATDDSQAEKMFNEIINQESKHSKNLRVLFERLCQS